MGRIRGFILSAAREAARIYLTATIASRMIKMADKQWVELKEEGTMRPVFDAQSLDLSHLNPDIVSYEPKAIRTEALQVTLENIGKLSLEFEEELFYDVNGRPYFMFSAKRFDAGEPDGQQPPSELCVRLTDWIIPLWDEIHIFRDGIFKHTFAFEADSSESGGLHSKGPVSLARPYVPEPPVLTNPGAFNMFKPSERVRHSHTGDVGVVTVVDVERPDGSRGVEVLLDNADRPFVFDPSNLEHLEFGSAQGIVEGPSGTSVIPRIDE